MQSKSGFSGCYGRHSAAMVPWGDGHTNVRQMGKSKSLPPASVFQSPSSPSTVRGLNGSSYQKEKLGFQTPRLSITMHSTEEWVWTERSSLNDHLLNASPGPPLAFSHGTTSTSHHNDLSKALQIFLWFYHRGKDANHDPQTCIIWLLHCTLVSLKSCWACQF